MIMKTWTGFEHILQNSSSQKGLLSKTCSFISPREVWDGNHNIWGTDVNEELPIQERQKN